MAKKGRSPIGRPISPPPIPFRRNPSPLVPGRGASGAGVQLPLLLISMLLLSCYQQARIAAPSPSTFGSVWCGRGPGVKAILVDLRGTRTSIYFDKNWVCMRRTGLIPDCLGFSKCLLTSQFSLLFIPLLGPSHIINPYKIWCSLCA